MHYSLGEFSQIPLLTTMLAAIERKKDRCRITFSRLLLIRSFNLQVTKDLHKVLDEFEFQPDPTTENRGNCHWAPDKVSINSCIPASLFTYD